MKTWEEYEKHLVRELEGRAVPGSGAPGWALGDVRTPAYLLEAKTTQRASYGVKRDLLDALVFDARSSGVVPLLALAFTNGPSVKRASSWVMMPERHFLDLVR